jgi:serine/threonine protein kinase
VKILSKRYQARRDVRQRMEVEARALAQFPDHVGVVRVFAAGLDPRVGPFIVMELLEGQTLRDVLFARRSLGVPRALALAALIARITDDLHALGIIHRDLKPENVFIVNRPDQPFRLVILDLGCIKSPFSGKTTDRAHAMGTVRYMSAEQLSGERVGPAADQVAIGHMLYEMIAGEHAFDILGRQHGGYPGAMIEAGWQVFAEFPPLGERTCPPDVWQIVSRLLARDPAQRFPSMRAAADALHVAVESLARQQSNEVLRSLAVHPQLSPPAPAVVAAAPAAGAPGRAVPDAPPIPALPSERKARAAPSTEPRRKRALSKCPPVGFHDGITVETLLIERGTNLVARHVLGEGATLGRDRDEADIVIDDFEISRRHCALQRDGQGPQYVLADLGSSNGTEIRGEKVSYAKLDPLEPFTIGDFTLRVLPPGLLDPDSQVFRRLGHRSGTALPRVEAEAVPPTAPAGRDRNADDGDSGGTSTALPDRILPILYGAIGILIVLILAVIAVRFWQRAARDGSLGASPTTSGALAVLRSRFPVDLPRDQETLPGRLRQAVDHLGKKSPFGVLCDESFEDGRVRLDRNHLRAHVVHRDALECAHATDLLLGDRPSRIHPPSPAQDVPHASSLARVRGLDATRVHDPTHRPTTGRDLGRDVACGEV